MKPHEGSRGGGAGDDTYDDVRAWRELPGGRRKLSHVRHHFDLALRWFYPRVDEVALDIRFDEAARDLSAACRWGGSGNRRGWGERYCWLRLDATPPRAQVMVWSRRIGWTEVPARAWNELKSLERDGVFADGSLLMENSPGEGVDLRCFLPRGRQQRLG